VITPVAVGDPPITTGFVDVWTTRTATVSPLLRSRSGLADPAAHAHTRGVVQVARPPAQRHGQREQERQTEGVSAEHKGYTRGTRILSYVEEIGRKVGSCRV
jgi:hypothetical protein